MTTQDQNLQIIHKQLIMDSTFHSCLNCESWSGNTIGVTKPEVKDTCMKYMQTPPAEVIVFGCPEWVYDIPF